MNKFDVCLGVEEQYINVQCCRYGHRSLGSPTVCVGQKECAPDNTRE